MAQKITLPDSPKRPMTFGYRVFYLAFWGFVLGWQVGVDGVHSTGDMVWTGIASYATLTRFILLAAFPYEAKQYAEKRAAWAAHVVGTILRLPIGREL